MGVEEVDALEKREHELVEGVDPVGHAEEIADSLEEERQFVDREVENLSGEETVVRIGYPLTRMLGVFDERARLRGDDFEGVLFFLFVIARFVVAALVARFNAECNRLAGDVRTREDFSNP